MKQPELVQAIQSLIPSVVYPQDFTVDANGIAKWNSTDTAQPTAAQVQIAYDSVVANQTNAKTQLSTARTLVLTTAKSAEGANITALTANQVRALVAVVLYKAGAIDGLGNVRPLSDWV